MFGSQDITFCSSVSCKHTECFRHQSHIVNSQYPHSIADFTEICEEYKEDNNGLV